MFMRDVALATRCFELKGVAEDSVELSGADVFTAHTHSRCAREGGRLGNR